MARHAPAALASAQAGRMARQVLRHLTGGKPWRLRPLGGGLTNFVFAARRGAETLVVRMSGQAAKGQDYLKEQWAMARARELGVPVPDVLEVGAAPIPYPYMISRQVDGVAATHHPDRRLVLHEMGRLARTVHGIRTTGFGHTFDWSGNLLSRKESWQDYLAREFRGDARLDVLDRHGMLPKPALRTLRATLKRIAGWDPDPVLNHGDLRLKNVIVGEDGTVAALLDWEFCTSNVAPYWDLSIALHDLSVDAKEEFLAGYGLRPAEVLEAAPVLRVFNVLNYAAVVDRAAQEDDAETLDRLRTRLHGGLELYAF